MGLKKEYRTFQCCIIFLYIISFGSSDDKLERNNKTNNTNYSVTGLEVYKHSGAKYVSLRRFHRQQSLRHMIGQYASALKQDTISRTLFEHKETSVPEASRLLQRRKYSDWAKHVANKYAKHLASHANTLSLFGTKDGSNPLWLRTKSKTSWARGTLGTEATTHSSVTPFAASVTEPLDYNAILYNADEDADDGDTHSQMGTTTSSSTTASSTTTSSTVKQNMHFDKSTTFQL